MRSLFTRTLLLIASAGLLQAQAPYTNLNPKDHLPDLVVTKAFLSPTIATPNLHHMCTAKGMPLDEVKPEEASSDQYDSHLYVNVQNAGPGVWPYKWEACPACGAKKLVVEVPNFRVYCAEPSDNYYFHNHNHIRLEFWNATETNLLQFVGPGVEHKYIHLRSWNPSFPTIQKVQINFDQLIREENYNHYVQPALANNFREWNLATGTPIGGLDPQAEITEATK